MKVIERFIKKFSKEVKEDNAALFIGAGFSLSCGYVDWKGLLSEIAEELSLSIDKETDLVSLAQYYYNEKRNRSGINRLIYEEFNEQKVLSENHRILARLPISTYWTTNYDSLIEDALKDAKKVPDVKRNIKQLSLTRPRRDAVVYKMHGDKEEPNETVILKEDYEVYYKRYAPFITALNGDLISKTFLFIGFSFKDPNLDYILSRMRVEYGQNNIRNHYTIMRSIQENEYEIKAEFDYDKRKQELFIEDLKRYNIETLLIDDYSEITNILRSIERQINSRNIFISGSASSYGVWQKEKALEFVHDLSQELIKKDYNIISGFGLGIGSSVITGALKEIYMNDRTINEDRLLLRPFPQGIVNHNNRKKLWFKYRQDMISRAGISIFLFGNKIDKDSNEVIEADGMLEEYEIAKKRGNLIIPVGCTGFVASKIWSELLEEYSHNEELIKLYDRLNHQSDNHSALIDAILEFINKYSK